MKYEKILFKDVIEGTNIALPIKEKSYYLNNEGEVKEVATVRIFNVIGINENKNSKTFTAEVVEINTLREVQPLIFDPDTEVFKIVDEEEKKKESKYQRKVIKG